MSSSSPTSPPGPLTTIFTPPTGCFDHFPQVWDYCGGKVELEIFYTERCFWSLAEHCYPTGAQVSSSSFEGRNGTQYPFAYTYSPGVLPSAFTGIAEDDNGWLTGCISYVSHIMINIWCNANFQGDGIQTASAGAPHPSRAPAMYSGVTHTPKVLWDLCPRLWFRGHLKIFRSLRPLRRRCFLRRLLRSTNYPSRRIPGQQRS